MKAKYKVEISQQAKLDLTDIVLYIKDILSEPSIANKYAELFKKEIDNLQYFPERFAIADSELIEGECIRRVVVKNYMIFYRVDEKEQLVKVDRIIYGASDWINKLIWIIKEK